MPVPGIKRGFIGFGTYAHHVLKYIHEHGPSTHGEIRQHCGWTTRCGATMLSRTILMLRKHGMLWVVGRTRKTGCRSVSLYDTRPARTGNLFIPLMSGNDRASAYRERKKLAVPSVFHFRGSIKL